MSELILIRHGETGKNVSGVLHSSGDVEKLTEKGADQITHTAEKMKEFAPVKIYSSNEARAIQSGELMAKDIGVPFESVAGLQERNWGEFSDQPWAEVQKVLSPMSLEERYTYIPPGGESWQQFEERLIHALSQILEKHKDKSVAVVCHGGSIRALMPFLLGVPKEESFKYDPDNASLTVFKRENDAFTAMMINDTAHLEK
jgi:broad specificity phosphatase PhoE